MTRERSGTVRAAGDVVGAAARARLLEIRAQTPTAPTAAIAAFSLL